MQTVAADAARYIQQMADFADQIIIVTRFGKKLSAELKKYANEIGLSKTMEISFWSYKEIE